MRPLTLAVVTTTITSVCGIPSGCGRLDGNDHNHADVDDGTTLKEQPCASNFVRNSNEAPQLPCKAS